MINPNKAPLDIENLNKVANFLGSQVINQRGIVELIIEYTHYWGGSEYNEEEQEVLYTYLIDRFNASLTSWLSDLIVGEDACWQFNYVGSRIHLQAEDIAERYIAKGSPIDNLIEKIYNYMIYGIKLMSDDVSQDYYLSAAFHFAAYFGHTFLDGEDLIHDEDN